MPPTVTVPEGSTTSTFDVTTFVGADVTVTITATLVVSQSASLTINDVPVLSGVGVNPSTVIGTTPSSGTATLTQGAPAGGAVVTLSSSNTTAASVPTNVTIPAQATAGNFPVTTTAVGAETPVTVTGVYGETRSAALQVEPCSYSAPPPTLFPSGDVVWFDDATPTGATLTGTWNWDASQKVSGTKSHTDGIAAGLHEHDFRNGTALTLTGSDRLFTYVFIDGCNPPREILLQWFDGTWAHTAYWGTDLMLTTSPRIRLGNLPAAGGWTRLEIPSGSIGLAGHTLTGMAFYTYDGRAWYDRAGKTSCTVSTAAPPTLANETVWLDETLPSGGVPYGTWNWDSSQKVTGNTSHTQPPGIGIQEHGFRYATATLSPRPSDTMSTYVMINPCDPPREILLGWRDKITQTWIQAYWGEDLIDWTPRVRLGSLPAAGQWVRLEASASAVGLVGKTIDGMSFVAYDGQVWWDRSGMISCPVPTSPPPTLGNETVWFDESLPAGAAAYGTWNWDTSQKATGNTSHTQPPGSAIQEHGFRYATATIAPASNNVITTYVLMNSCDPPRELLLGFRDHNTQGWIQVYWGEDLIAWTPRYRVGNLPTAGQWTRLEIPAAAAGLAGKTIDGMSFVVYEGQAWWDRTGMTTTGSGLLMREDPVRLAEDSTPAPIALLFGASLVSRANSVPAGLNRYHFYTPELNLMAETEQTTSPTPTVQYEYIWFGGQPVAQIDARTSTTHWTFTDHLATPILQTDASGAVDWRAEYDPYGSVYSFRAGAPRHQPLRLPGQEGEGGSGEREYNIFRWYRAGWGRYTQSDPMEWAGREYAYASGNPIANTDRLGLLDAGSVARAIVNRSITACEFAEKVLGGPVVGALQLVLQASDANPAEFENQGKRCDRCKKPDCNKLNDAVQQAKRRVGDLGACRAGMSRWELLQRKAAWLALATARVIRDINCWDGGDEGHQQAQATAWDQVGNCSRLLGM